VTLLPTHGDDGPAYALHPFPREAVTPAKSLRAAVVTEPSCTNSGCGCLAETHSDGARATAVSHWRNPGARAVIRIIL
jgi:hypothetical protein